MRPAHLCYLRCPVCGAALDVSAGISVGDRIKSGDLRCRDCAETYPIVDFIPRFTPPGNYADSFGLEWNRHARSQYDSTSGVPLSKRRFQEETGWPNDLKGETVIEAGSGSGRFTEHALDTGATVLSIDYSRAVDANYASNGQHPNLLLVQGDAAQLPFAAADRIFCFGVLQHTASPERTLRGLVAHLRPSGEVVADIYIKSFAKYVLGTKYWVRPLTRRMSPSRLYDLTCRYVDTIWPLARQIRRIPRIGVPLNWRLLIGDYSQHIQDDNVLREWAKLDTFDMLSPRYDQPARKPTVEQWCGKSGLRATVQKGYNGLVIHGRLADNANNREPRVTAARFDRSTTEAATTANR